MTLAFSLGRPQENSCGIYTPPGGAGSQPVSVVVIGVPERRQAFIVPEVGDLFLPQPPGRFGFHCSSCVCVRVCRLKSNSSCCWLPGRFPWTPSGVPNGHRHFRIPQWCHPITRYIMKSILSVGWDAARIFHWNILSDLRDGNADHSKGERVYECGKHSCSYDLSRKSESEICMRFFFVVTNWNSTTTS